MSVVFRIRKIITNPAFQSIKKPPELIVPGALLIPEEWTDAEGQFG
jgi:hypothetical protein